MIKAAQFDDALYFLERFPLIALEDKDKTENSVRLSKGYQLMSNHKFAEAMRLFAQANLDLAQVVGMMPGLLPDDEDFRLSQESLFIQQTFEPEFMKPAAAELMWFLDQTNVPVQQKRLADTCRSKCLWHLVTPLGLFHLSHPRASVTLTKPSAHLSSTIAYQS